MGAENGCGSLRVITTTDAHFLYWEIFEVIKCWNRSTRLVEKKMMRCDLGHYLLSYLKCCWVAVCSSTRFTATYTNPLFYGYITQQPLSV